MTVILELKTAKRVQEMEESSGTAINAAENNEDGTRPGGGKFRRAWGRFLQL